MAGRERSQRSTMADFATGDVPMQSKQGLPGAKQQQSEESLPALDEEERKAVLQRSRARLEARQTPGTVTPKSGRAGSAKTPKSGRSSLPGYMTPKTGGRSSRSGAKSSRSSALTNRTSSPTGRYHPNVERRIEIRKVRTDPHDLRLVERLLSSAHDERVRGQWNPHACSPLLAYFSHSCLTLSRMIAGGPHGEHRLPCAERSSRQ